MNLSQQSLKIQSCLVMTSQLLIMESIVSNVECPLDNWLMFYCENSTMIVKTLQAIERKYFDSQRMLSGNVGREEVVAL